MAAANTTMDKIWDEAQAVDANFLEKVRESGVKVVRLSPEETANAKKILYANEWPFMETIVGPEIMDMLRKIAGIN